MPMATGIRGTNFVSDAGDNMGTNRIYRFFTKSDCFAALLGLGPRQERIATTGAVGTGQSPSAASEKLAAMRADENRPARPACEQGPANAGPPAKGWFNYSI